MRRVYNASRREKNVPLGIPTDRELLHVPHAKREDHARTAWRITFAIGALAAIFEVAAWEDISTHSAARKAETGAVLFLPAAYFAARAVRYESDARYELPQLAQPKLPEISPAFVPTYGNHGHVTLVVKPEAEQGADVINLPTAREPEPSTELPSTEELPA